ncbi:hypothetical protein [uncultured Cellulomonas sp.]|uniref:hypothetical protein n=1 Tax=uncultured Cellulomonas sp. TaxID=189682 RepID=UPI00260F1AEF|nr:hypothetical protein [uncultured Cellulomonas sp.]
MRRLLWVGVGAAATVATLRKAREVTERHVPAGARSALGAVAGLGAVVQTARAEFATATAQREAELRAALLAGADPARARSTVDAWRAERSGAGHGTAGRRAADATPDAVRPGAPAGTSSAETSTAGAPAPGGAPRPGSAAAARATGAHRAQDPEDGPAGYSFF